MTTPEGACPPRRRGGPRPGAGRPRASTEPLRRTTVTLPESYLRQLPRAGGGNLSEGIRLVLEFARTPSGGFWLDAPCADPRAG
jgi:hypothetical protein